MKRSLILLFLIAVAHSIYAQDRYQPGYYVNSAGEKIEGLIRNDAWRYTPRAVLFKASESAESIELSPETAQIIEVPGQLKFVGGTFKVDFSSDDLRKITPFKEARLEANDLFLKVVIAGKATLYEYTREGLRRYFYSVDNASPAQLIYKAYQSDNVVQYNRLFKTQLWDDLKCESISLDDIQKVEYYKKDLKGFFTTYNQCQNSEIQDFTPQRVQSGLKVWIRPGGQFSSVELTQSLGLGPRVFESDPQAGLRIGALLEYTLPFRNGKLSVVAEPTYQSTSVTPEVAIGFSSRILTADVDYSSIVLPIGIKYYAFEFGKSRVSLATFIISDLIDFSSTVAIEGTPGVEVNAQMGISGEIEYQYDGKYSLGLQYGIQRDLISNTATANNISAQFSYLSVVLGYNVF